MASTPAGECALRRLDACARRWETVDADDFQAVRWQQLAATSDDAPDRARTRDRQAVDTTA